MKKIAVCYKWVLSGEDIKIDEKSRHLDFSKCKWQIGEYDRVALEAGVRLKEKLNASLIGVTCGTTSAESAKDALSRGPDAVHYFDHPLLLNADSSSTAKVLAAMLKTLDVDIVICAEGSSDDYAQQVGPRIAALMNVPSISYARSISAEGALLSIERKLDQEIETVELSEKAVISVIPDIGEAPIPGVKQILSAKKKPSHAMSLAEIGLDDAAIRSLVEIVDIKAPANTRKAVQMNPETSSIEESVASLVKQLASDGVI